MPTRSYNISVYDSILKSELVKLLIIAAVLVVIFVSMIIYSVVQIRNDKTRKTPYVQLIAVILVSMFLLTSLGSQIFAFGKDIVEEAYIQYEGPVNVRTKRIVVFGGIPTGHDEYIISFEYNGEYIELSTRKDYGMNGNIENLYIVYSRRSKFILEIIE